MTQYTATYSPEDNKLRLYSVSRLDAETFARVKGAGFKWAPRQELFVAPMWTPERADLLEELAGEIGDEDTSLVDRAEARAERFEEYSEHRARDASAAHAAVHAIADGIPFGQPILVGHHSERRARKDAERIDNGMRRAVKMWDTSRYWVARAAGAIRHAKYKELPAVRARRIKTIEADRRRVERSKATAEKGLAAWTAEALTLEGARWLAGNTEHGRLTVCRTEGQAYGWSAWDVLRPDGERYQACPAKTLDEVREVARRVYPRAIERCNRWLAHYDNRLAYERAMLEESGWTPPPKPKTKSDLPLLNYGGRVSYRNPYQRGEILEDDAHGMTRAELAAINKDYKGTRLSACGTHRVRTALINEGGAGRRTLRIVYLTDSKQHPRPNAAEVARKVAEERADEERAALYKAAAYLERQQQQAEAREERAEGADFEAMRASLRHGVQTVSAPQLFPTPPDLAERMADLAELAEGQRVLEPSAGTGRLLAAMGATLALEVIAVEINAGLAGRLRGMFRAVSVWGRDFLELNGELGTFDRVVMNPPFQDGADIRHILHARTLLRPGGHLVALCANGPRQQERLQPIADTWEELPAGTFDGTDVRAALLTIRA